MAIHFLYNPPLGCTVVFLRSKIFDLISHDTHGMLMCTISLQLFHISIAYLQLQHDRVLSKSMVPPYLDSISPRGVLSTPCACMPSPILL